MPCARSALKFIADFSFYLYRSFERFFFNCCCYASISSSPTGSLRPSGPMTPKTQHRRAGTNRANKTYSPVVGNSAAVHNPMQPDPDVSTYAHSLVPSRRDDVAFVVDRQSPSARVPDHVSAAASKALFVNSPLVNKSWWLIHAAPRGFVNTSPLSPSRN